MHERHPILLSFESVSHHASLNLSSLLSSLFSSLSSLFCLFSLLSLFSLFSLLFSLLFSSLTYIEGRILGLDEFMNVVVDGAEEILIQNQTRIEGNRFSSLSGRSHAACVGDGG